MQPRLTDSLKFRCLRLPKEQRQDLVSLLLNSFNRNSLESAPEKTFQSLYNAVETHYGLDLRSRAKVRPTADVKAAFILTCREKIYISQSELGRRMNLRPCTVFYHEGRMRDALACPGSNPTLVEIYNEIQKLI